MSGRTLVTTPTAFLMESSTRNPKTASGISRSSRKARRNVRASLPSQPLIYLANEEGVEVDEAEFEKLLGKREEWDESWEIPVSEVEVLQEREAMKNIQQNRKHQRQMAAVMDKAAEEEMEKNREEDWLEEAKLDEEQRQEKRNQFRAK